MPFLGRDWRSDGDLWVRTGHGWETAKNWRVRIHENINFKVLQKLLKQSIHHSDRNTEVIECPRRPIHIHIPKSTLSNVSLGQSDVLFTEAIVSLDLNGALKDGRRSDYVYKLMTVLVEDKLSIISGAVQNQLVGLVESALTVACDSGEKKNQLVYVLEKMVSHLSNHTYCFQHLGGLQMWIKHTTDVSRMLDKARRIPTHQRCDDDMLMLTQLPPEMLREILLYLSSQEDVVNTGRSCPKLKSIVSDERLWKDLCFSHFTQTEIDTICQSFGTKDKMPMSHHWYLIYQRLRKRFGHAESFADGLCFCEMCSTVFWKSGGHPCKSENAVVATPLTPSQAISLFHI